VKVSSMLKSVAKNSFFYICSGSVGQLLFTINLWIIRSTAKGPRPYHYWYCPCVYDTVPKIYVLLIQHSSGDRRSVCPTRMLLITAFGNSPNSTPIVLESFVTSLCQSKNNKMKYNGRDPGLFFNRHLHIRHIQVTQLGAQINHKQGLALETYISQHCSVLGPP